MSLFSSLGKNDCYSQKWFVRNNAGIKTKLFPSSKTAKIFIENSDELISLEGVSFKIWQLLKKPILFEKLLKELKKEYDVLDEVLKKDVNDFLSHLKKYKLIKISKKSNLN